MSVEPAQLKPSGVMMRLLLLQSQVRWLSPESGTGERSWILGEHEKSPAPAAEPGAEQGTGGAEDSVWNIMPEALL